MVVVFVDDSSINSKGVLFTYQIADHVSGGRIYWLVAGTHMNVSPSSVRAGTGDSCSGSALQVDDDSHDISIRCDLQPGAQYKIWMAVDSNGKGQGLELATRPGVTFTVASSSTSAPSTITSSSTTPGRPY